LPFPAKAFNPLLFRYRDQRGRQEDSEVKRHNIRMLCHSTEILRGDFSFPEADTLEINPRPDLQVEPSISIL